MRALLRIAAISLAGGALYHAGMVNAIVIDRPDRYGAVIEVLAIGVALLLLLLSLRGTGRGEAVVPDPVPRRTARTMRFMWTFISITALLSIAWLFGLAQPRGGDSTQYHNDAIALNECSARMLLAGENPYVSMDLFDCYAQLGIGADRTTPLRRGQFADVAIYPTDDQLDQAWALYLHTGDSAEFVWRPSYPALSFVLILPWVALGFDTNLLYLGCLFAAMALVLVRAPKSVRPWLFTGMLGAVSLIAFTIGGSADLLYVLPLVAAWLWRERSWSGVVFGIACAVKQIAWFFAPFYFLRVLTEHGWREAARRAGFALVVFVVANLPFIVNDARAWVVGVVTPVAEPMFPRGAGLVFLSTNDVLPLFPAFAFLVLEAAVGVAVLVVAWRTRHSSPELGVILPLVPLFFAYRSLFSYFFLLPLLAYAAIARMPLGELRPAAARASGGLMLFASRVRS